MSFAEHWTLDPDVIFLNHGSFGACPRVVLEHQSALRERMERQPVQFFVRDLPGEIDAARERLAAFLGADPAGVAFVSNATTAVNAVMRSLRFTSGDQILITNQSYNACANVCRHVASRTGARVVEATLPFPLSDPEEAVERILDAVTDRTRLALISHVSSPTGLVLPIERIVRELEARDVDTLVDGAHALGMLPLELDALGAAYYTGNCHKWLCAPKGAAFLHARADRRALVRPAIISHGYNAQVSTRSRFHLEFDWIGTLDPTPWLCVPKAIDTMAAMVPGGWPEIMQRNHALALASRDVLCEALEVEPPCPDSMIGSLSTVPIWDSHERPKVVSPLYADPLQEDLLGRFRIEVPVIPWPRLPSRLVRASSQLYNTHEHHVALAEALVALRPSKQA